MEKVGKTLPCQRTRTFFQHKDCTALETVRWTELFVARDHFIIPASCSLLWGIEQLPCMTATRGKVP